jgi:hypothetical protein
LNCEGVAMSKQRYIILRINVFPNDAAGHDVVYCSCCSLCIVCKIYGENVSCIRCDGRCEMALSEDEVILFQPKSRVSLDTRLASWKRNASVWICRIKVFT